MSLVTARSIASGAVFGAALTAAGVYSPSVIVGQLHMEDFRMLKTFLTASASSVVAIVIAQGLGFSSCKPRTPSSLGIFGTYDGNIIGGLLLGSGMALTGACPGTVLPQLATVVPSARYVLLGCIIGGIIWSKLKSHLVCSVRNEYAFKNPAVYEELPVSKAGAMITYEAIILSIVAGATYYFPEKSAILFPPVVGGLLIGVAQATSLFLTTFTLGVSNAYEQVGDLFWWLEQTILEGKRIPRPTIKGTAFAIGGLLGSVLLSRLVDLPTPKATVVIESGRAVLGGVGLVLGARMAGGCTSGHGISGMSQLSISSFITVACMFGSGMGLSLFV